MGENQPHPVLFQDIKDRVDQIGFSAEFNVVPGILGDLAEEFVQILGQLGNWEPVILGMIFLLEYDSIQAAAEDLDGRLIELLGENIRVQVIFILNKTRTPSSVSWR
jgi:hypothetical protein